MEIIITESAAAMGLAAAKIIAVLVRDKPSAVLGMTTGATPQGLYQELVRMHREEGLDFSKVTTFNLDEYVGLAPTHEQSSRRFMQDKLFDHVNVAPQNTYVPSGLAEDYDAHCRWYEERIRHRGGVDLQLLGIGSNGHIGYNEPGSSLGSRTRVLTLTPQTRQANAAGFGGLENVPTQAVTIGVATILDARRILLMANGQSKAAATAAGLEGPLTSMVPASALQLHPDVTVLLDPLAAAGLKMADYYLWVQKNKASLAKGR